jgi:(p)ppGpp synthase/HD superfamily hydrolase
MNNLDMTNTITVTKTFINAVAFASKAHEGDVRKGTTIPYLSHLLQVAGLVWEFGGSETEAIGGLLHDTAEDAGGEPMLDDIEQIFGPAVAGIVRENSDSITDRKEIKAPWRERKEAYIAAISHKSEPALLVSMCDKLHNVRSLIVDTRNMGALHWNRFNAPKADLLWYYDALVEAFEGRVRQLPRLEPLARELVEAVAILKFEANVRN